jgi:hypothetical protein
MGQNKNFDLVIAGDFRLMGGTSTATAAEIRAYKASGLSFALLPLHAHFFPESQPVHAEIQALIDSLAIPVLTGDHAASCALLLLHNPVVLQNSPLDRVRVLAKHCVIVAHSVPVTPWGALAYDPWAVDRMVRKAFGTAPVWAPITPVCREGFRRCGFNRPILASDWSSIMETEAWGEPRLAPRFDRISIGRHSRPDPDKWPATRADFLMAYPDAEDIDVHLLGAGELIRDLIGKTPANWKLYPFNAISPRVFLNTIDYFVYFHHPSIVEGFGRALAEAAAAGCVLVLPPYLKSTFGPGAVYCEPPDVQAAVRRLHQDRDAFARQSRAGHDLVKENFGAQSLIQLCRATMDSPKIDWQMLASSQTVPATLARQRTRWDNRFRWRLRNLRRRLELGFGGARQAS